MTTPSSLLERDRLYTWHPFTQEKTAPTPLPVAKAEGIWLELDDGHRLVDAISSWWTNVHGHGHPLMAQAISQQVETLDHVLFAGCTHPGAVDVAEELVKVDRVRDADIGASLLAAVHGDHALGDGVGGQLVDGQVKALAGGIAADCSRADSDSCKFF